MKYLLVSLLMLIGNSTFSQNRPGSETRISREVMVPVNKTIIYVDTFATTASTLIIDKSSIESTNVINGPDTNSVFLKLKSKDVKFLRIAGIFSSFNIGEDLRSYRVCINRLLIRDQHLILADRNFIKSVSVIEEPRVAQMETVKPGEKFLNIELFP